MWQIKTPFIVALLLAGVYCNAGFAQEPGSEVLSEESGTIASPPAALNNDSGKKQGPDQGLTAIKAATARGELLAYAKLAKRVNAKIPGEVVRVQLFRRNSSIWVYEIAVLGVDGRYTFAVVDAATGDVIRKRTK
jgi:hypothetical protein